MGRVHDNLTEIDNRYRRFHSKRNEMKKIKHPKRQKILESYKLSDEQIKQIDSLFLDCYGKKVPYDWHRLYSSFTGKFDCKYIPELLFIPEIEAKFVPREYMSTFADKNMLPMLVSDIEYIKTPEIYVSCIHSIFRNRNLDIITIDEAIKDLENIGKVFLKPTLDSNSGRGCGMFNFKKGIDLNSGESVKDIILKAGNNFNFQEIIENCDSIKRLHPNSINTFRIVTYIWDNKICHFPIIMRIGRGKAILDNAHQGGIFIGVEDNGKFRNCAFTEFKDEYYHHPDTGIVFAEYSIPETQKVLNAVKNIHKRFPQIGMISWDATVDKYGRIVIIEINLEGQTVWLSQMAHGKGAFGDNTEAILKMISEK